MDDAKHHASNLLRKADEEQELPATLNMPHLIAWARATIAWARSTVHEGQGA